VGGFKEKKMSLENNTKIEKRLQKLKKTTRSNEQKSTKRKGKIKGVGECYSPVSESK